MRRCELKPGQIFGVDHAFGPRSLWFACRGAYVVLGAKHEVEFWTGAPAFFGDVMSSMEVEVLA